MNLAGLVEHWKLNYGTIEASEGPGGVALHGREDVQGNFFNVFAINTLKWLIYTLDGQFTVIIFKLCYVTERVAGTLKIELWIMSE